MWQGLDTNGEFYFNVDSSYSGNQLVFQVLGKNPEDYKIGLKEPSPLEYSELEFTPNPLLPEFREEILQRSIHNQIENSYFQFRPDSAKTLDTKQIFDRKEKTTYLLDDYTRFKTVSETLLEIIKDVSTERIAKDQYLIRVKGYDYASPSGNLPLILMDGQIITDHDALLKYDARNIEEIKVLRHEFIIGPEQFQGALIINTKNGNGYTSFQNANDSSIVEIFKPEARKNYFVQRYDNGKTDSRLPDDRIQLLWLPHKHIHKNEADFNFFTSDVPGIFEIRIEGLTEENLPVSVCETFTVE
ncbi:hypothetical protein NYZ99_00785 [Maribacter litopenaei]|uniref:TonB-dependent Receptor Plug Domain n=1 Tax=Maribacter litopenaei TaxID=2976127 RepID=A0ABY5Y8L1_9FLAO|nr:hypothetical protein [Maribacter litopenaei]UWX55203.1 hypothetical protein NYZ99_00785 [Maribacter litopenaei]